MTKRIILTLIMTVLSLVLYAEKYSISLWGGMNSVSMGEINDMFGEYGTEESEEINSGMQSALEFSLGEDSKLQPTFRISGISAGKGKFIGAGSFKDEDNDTDVDEDGDADVIVIGGEYTPMITSIEVGLKFPWIEYGKYKNSIGAFIGYGMASIPAKEGLLIDSADVSALVYREETYTGSAITLSIVDYNEIALSSRFSLGLILGYNIAKVSEVKDSDGNVLMDFDGDKIAIDYSGLCYGLSLKYKF
ncbi:MAG: hypothetical protein SNJ64_03170 [Endomicrobiia bacterium]